MKLLKTAEGKKMLRLSRAEWETIGREKGWDVEAGFGDFMRAIPGKARQVAEFGKTVRDVAKGVATQPVGGLGSAVRNLTDKEFRAKTEWIGALKGLQTSMAQWMKRITDTLAKNGQKATEADVAKWLGMSGGIARLNTTIQKSTQELGQESQYVSQQRAQQQRAPAPAAPAAPVAAPAAAPAAANLPVAQNPAP